MGCTSYVRKYNLLDRTSNFSLFHKLASFLATTMHMQWCCWNPRLAKNQCTVCFRTDLKVISLAGRSFSPYKKDKIGGSYFPNVVYILTYCWLDRWRTGRRRRWDPCRWILRDWSSRQFVGANPQSIDRSDYGATRTRCQRWTDHRRCRSSWKQERINWQFSGRI